MNILLYSPDNGITRNFMPHLWMFVLKSLTPAEHEVFLIDGNAQPMTEDEMARFVRSHDIRLVGISAMTRARAYRIADAIRATGAQALGRDGEPRHADAVALGEADYTWPKIVQDTARGTLQEIYRPVDADNHEVKPNLDDYPRIPWDTIPLEQFNMIGKLLYVVRWLLRRKTKSWESLPSNPEGAVLTVVDFCTVNLDVERCSV